LQSWEIDVMAIPASAKAVTFIVTRVFWGYYRTPEAQRDWPAIRRSLKLCDRLFGMIDTVLSSHAFLIGNSLSLADIPAGTTLYRYFELDIERPLLPNVTAWYERLKQRPAYQEHVMIPFFNLRGRLAH
jgi:glutathione S-transferase